MVKVYANQREDPSSTSRWHFHRGSLDILLHQRVFLFGVTCSFYITFQVIIFAWISTSLLTTLEVLHNFDNKPAEALPPRWRPSTTTMPTPNSSPSSC